MAINKTIIQSAIDELRADIARSQRALEVLEGLVAGESPAPKQRAKVATKVAPPAAVVGVGKGGGWPRARTCDDCGTKFTALGSRTKCPKCNPRTITAAEHYASKG